MTIEKEFELLHQYINYRVDWFANTHRFGKIIYINNLAIGPLTPKQIFEVYKRMGVMFWDNKIDPQECMTFEQFKTSVANEK